MLIFTERAYILSQELSTANAPQLSLTDTPRRVKCSLFSVRPSMSIHMFQWFTVIFVPPVLLQEAAAPQLSARKIRFNQFASVLYQQEPYMTPRDFLYSVMLENVDRKMQSNDAQSVYSVHWMIRWVGKWCEWWSSQSPDSSQASWTGGFIKIHWNCGKTVGK